MPSELSKWTELLAERDRCIADLKRRLVEARKFISEQTRSRIRFGLPLVNALRAIATAAGVDPNKTPGEIERAVCEKLKPPGCLDVEEFYRDEPERDESIAPAAAEQAQGEEVPHAD